MKWSYCITSSEDNSNSFASRFGWGSRVPMLARVFPSGKKESTKRSVSLLDITIPNILVISAKPAASGDGIVLHLREIEGKKAEIDLQKMIKNVKFKSVREVSVIEEEIVDIEKKIEFKPYEIKFIKIEI